MRTARSAIAMRIDTAETGQALVDTARWNEARYRTLFDLGPVAVYSCDASGVIQEFNRRAAELWGCAPRLGDTDIRFCGSFKLFRPDGSFMPHEQCPMADVIAGRIADARDAEVIIERPDGSRITVMVNIQPLKNERGVIIGAINCFYDITARKKSEELFRESDRRKNEFLAMLAHELRNPLAPICSSVEVMRRALKAESSSAMIPATPSQEACNASSSDLVTSAMGVLERQLGQMVRLVDDLLDVGRISTGKMILHKERIELSSVVHHVVESVRSLYVNSGHTLTVTLPQEPVYLNADPTRLAQIVGNLVNNACKFTDRGGQIWLTVERTEESKAADADLRLKGSPPDVVIRVRDTGRGIASDQLPRIFDMFMQGDTARDGVMTGLGIGLPLARTLAQLHGGTLEASSAGIGQGSEFVVRLPVMVDASAVSAANRNQPVTPPSLRILVVDDNRDAAAMLATMLGFSGHETHTAHTGIDAVEAVRRLQPDVVLLDIGLPDLSGYEVAHRIREQQDQKVRTLLIAITGWGQVEDRRHAKEAGFDAHMVKPVQESALVKLFVDLDAGAYSGRTKASG